MHLVMLLPRTIILDDFSKSAGTAADDGWEALRGEQLIPPDLVMYHMDSDGGNAEVVPDFTRSEYVFNSDHVELFAVLTRDNVIQVRH